MVLPASAFGPVVGPSKAACAKAGRANGRSAWCWPASPSVWIVLHSSLSLSCSVLKTYSLPALFSAGRNRPMPMAISRVRPLNIGSTRNCRRIAESSKSRCGGSHPDDRAPDVHPPGLYGGGAEEGTHSAGRRNSSPTEAADPQLGGEQDACQRREGARGDEGPDHETCGSGCRSAQRPWGWPRWHKGNGRRACIPAPSHMVRVMARTLATR